MSDIETVRARTDAEAGLIKKKKKEIKFAFGSGHHKIPYVLL